MKKNSSYRFFSYIIVIMFLLNSSETFAQWTFDIVGTVKQEETKKRLAGATITVKKDGAVWKTLTVPENGKFELNLLPDAIYIIEFSKPGLVTKRIQVSSKDVPPEDAKYGLEFPLEMNLFKKMDGLDVSILNKPIAKIRYDVDIGYPNFDEEYTKSIKSELDRLKKELAAKLKKQEEERKAKQAAYDAAIAAGNKAFGSKKWSEAQPFYTKASQIFADEDYPKSQLKLISENIKKLAAAEKEYTNTIALADAAFNKKDLDNALTNYQKATQLKPTEKYPKEKITAIKALKANQNKIEADYKAAIASADGFFTKKDYKKAKTDYQKALSLKANEVYPKNKLTEIDKILADLAKKDTDYNNAIKKGDDLMGAKNYKTAKEQYQLAKNIKPTEKYPTGKIAEIDKLLADLAKANLDKKALDTKYNSLISQADNFLGNKSYDEAKLKYQAALSVKNEETYPKNKIAEIDGILAAIAKKEQDANLASAAEKKKREYFNAIIAQADGEFAAKKYQEAIKKYNEALGVIPNEAYPKNKIKEINDVLAKLEDKEQNSLLAQKALDEKYNKLITSGDAAFSTKDYGTAKTKFRGALSIKPTESYPKNKIDEINKILAGLAKQEQEKQSKNNALAQKKLRYNGFIKSGDSYFLKKQYQQSISSYKSALGIMPSESYPKDKIDEINKILTAIAKKETDNKNAAIAEKEKRKKYNNLIYKADRLFKFKKYENSKLKYNEALAIYANEKYPKNKIAEINILLQKNKTTTNQNIVVSNTNLGPRAKIDDAKEKEIEAKIAAMLNENNKKREKKLQDEITSINKQEEIRIKMSIDKTNNAWKDVSTANNYLKQLAKNGDKLSIQNSDSLLAFAKDINEIENNRVIKADKERLTTKDALLLVEKESLKYKENADENYQQKIDSQHVFVSDVNEKELIFIENADKKRTENGQQLANLYDKMNEADKKNYERAKNQALDVKAYELELNKQEQILITASLDKTANNKKNIDNLIAEIEQTDIEKRKKYTKNDDDLFKRKEVIRKIEEQRIVAADNARALNVKELQKVQEQIIANLNSNNTNYYEKIPKIKAYENYLNEQEQKLINRASENRQKEKEAYETNKTKLGLATQSQENRYKEFVSNLAEERRRNNDFQSDLVALADEKRILANADLSNFYKPKKKMINNLSELPKTYPQGITEEVNESGNTIEIKRTKVTGNHADVYKRIFYKWGGTFYTKNGVNITQALWNKESIEK